MNDRTRNDALLRDILAEDSLGFRGDLREETLLLARRRRRFRQARIVVVPCALILGFVLLSWRWFAPAARQGDSQVYVLVRTEPMTLGNLVATQPLQSDRLVVSAKSSYFVTTADDGYRTKPISDEELLNWLRPIQQSSFGLARIKRN
jgi:hypothetical protein